MTRTLTLAAILATGIAIGVGVQRSNREGLLTQAAAREDLPASIGQLQAVFNTVAEAATKSVVHITTQTAGDAFGMRPGGSSFGSGVILTAEGHIVTNHHVVQNARRLWVRFVDGSEIEAKVVGLDPESDLALVRIDPAGRALRPMVIGDAERVRVGDFVLAIGSPHGYTHSVTSGIVSAKHRSTEWGKAYEDFIQTDAAINPGNSGGALVNLNGELVGINAAIVTRGQGSEGIGLAISSGLVRWVSERLMRDGRVRRGFLGVKLAEIDQRLVDMKGFDGIRTPEDLWEAVGLDGGGGLWIDHVDPGTPAAKAGLQKNDVILEFDGRRVSRLSSLLFGIAETEPGRRVSVRLLRDRKSREVQVELGERPPIAR